MKKEYFLEKAREVHGDKYDYSLLPEDIKYNGKIEIRCPIHGKFSQLVNNHLRNRSCPKCSKRYKMSSLEYIEEVKKSIIISMITL